MTRKRKATTDASSISHKRAVCRGGRGLDRKRDTCCVPGCSRERQVARTSGIVRSTCRLCNNRRSRESKLRKAALRALWELRNGVHKDVDPGHETESCTAADSDDDSDNEPLLL